MALRYWFAARSHHAATLGKYRYRVALLAVTLAAFSAQIRAQAPPKAGVPLPPFEVASVRQNRSGDSRVAVYFQAGRFTAENATIKALIAYAFNVKDFQISGGPGWIDSERYDVVAKEEDSAAEKLQRLPWFDYREQVDRMVQSLLADRFHLTVIHQPRQSNIYALVVAKNGPKLRQSALDTALSDIRGHRGHLIAKAMSLAQLADFLSWSSEVGVRKVVDQTGVSGNFDFTLDWTPDPSPPTTPMEPPSGGAALAGAPRPDSSAPTMFTAIQEQLGLKLESTKGPVDFLVIDHVERPSEN